MQQCIYQEVYFYLNYSWFFYFFRYYLQAEDELDCNWLFMKGQEDDDAAWFTWLSKQM